MSQMKRVIDAGPLHLEFLYPRVAVRDGETARREKRKLTGAAQARMNHAYAVQRLACLMAVNFSPGDHVVILTFDDEHLPPDRAGVLRAFDNFCRGLARERAKRGAPLLALASEEHRHGDGRWHIHAVINNAGDLPEIIRRWKYGLVLETPFAQSRHKNALTLSSYYTKERRDRVGQRRWLRRGKLRNSTTESWRVPDGDELRLSPGAVLLEQSSQANEYGKWQFLFYMDKDGTAKRRRRPPRTRKRGKKRAA